MVETTAQDIARPGIGSSDKWGARHWAALLLILLAGIGSRVIYVDRPLDERLLAPWREADYVQLARNFYREGTTPFYPQIDWRGDSPGYAEMEFPLLPWFGATLYRHYGYNEQLLRIPAAVLGGLALLVFAGLAAAALPPLGALFATAAFALNPLLVYLGNAIQPEPLMLLLSLIAMTLIWRWERRPRSATLLAACAVTALAILAKSPAAYLGLVLAYTVLRKLGRRALTDVHVLICAAVAILPPLAWYVWAHHFWTQYGNSLGVSNESHFFGLDMLAPPKFVFGLFKLETGGVFSPIGWILVLAALRAPRIRVEPFLVWYGAVLLFYLVTARTTADNWAFYYHSVAVAPGCLLMGAGVAGLVAGGVLPARWTRLVSHEPELGIALAALTIGSIVALTGWLIYKRDTLTDYVDMRRCSAQFATLVPANERIVVHGGDMFDEYHKPVAHNESMIFAWMDRKGFNYGTEELSVATLDRIAARGGRFWMVRRDELHKDNLREQVEAHYRRLADCAGTYELYDLRPQSQ